MRKKVSDYDDRDKNLLAIGFASYRDYLRSRLWAKVRKKRLKLDQEICLLCGDVANQVHHLDYGMETLLGIVMDKMASICDNCHNDVEYFPDGRKRTFPESVKRFTALRCRFKNSSKLLSKQREADLGRLREINRRRRELEEERALRSTLSIAGKITVQRVRRKPKRKRPPRKTPRAPQMYVRWEHSANGPIVTRKSEEELREARNPAVAAAIAKKEDQL